jgi:RimJ/RimL family protein N-acetyltransferase
MLRGSRAAGYPSSSVTRPFDPRPVVLEGGLVRLEPLAEPLAAALFDAGREAALWQHLARGPFTTAEDARGWIRAALAEAHTGGCVPFAIVERAGERVLGSTRYMDIRRLDRALEIGWTWLARAAQRTGINTECKWLLLCHAFDVLGAYRVQLKTDLRNLRSQQAIERLGARREGVLRRHMVVRDGYVRDTVLYAITDADWPELRVHMERLLRRT